eukprot:jgi/Hompol1/2894/HPOL_003065-RA
MAAEISVKNKMLYDLKDKQNWLSSELASMRSSGMKLDNLADHSEQLAALLKRPDSAEMDSFKLQLIQSLMLIRSELKKSKDVIDKQEVVLMDLGRKRTLAEEEAAHLRSISEARRVNPGSSVASMESQRIIDLEARLRETTDDLSKVQAKVKQWAQASKRNQEGRMFAEACQKTAESDLVQARLQLEKSKQVEEDLRKRLEESRSPQGPSTDLAAKIVELEKAIDERDSRIQALLADKASAQARIDDFEQTMQEAYATVEALEEEAASLQDQLAEKSRQAQASEEHIVKLRAETDTLMQKNGVSHQELKWNHEEVCNSLQNFKERCETLTASLQNVPSSSDSAASPELAAQLEEAKSTIAKLEAELTATKAAMDQSTLRWKEDIARLEDLNEHSMETSDALEAELGQKSLEIHDLNAKLQTMNAELEHLRAQLGGAAVPSLSPIQLQELNDLRNRLDEAEFIAARNGQELVTKQEEIADLEQIVQESEAHLDKLSQQIELRDATIAELKKAAAQPAESFANVASAGDAQASVNKLQIDLDAAVELSAAQSRQLAEAHSQRDAIALELAALKAAGAQISSDASTSDSNVAQLTLRIEELDATVAKMREAEQAAVANQDALKVQLDKAREALAMYEEDLRDRDQYITSLEQDVEESERRIDELRGGAKNDTASAERIAELTALVEAKDQRIAELEKLQATVSDLETRLAAAEAAAAAAPAPSKNSDQLVADLKEEIAERDAAIQMLEESIQDL